MTESAGDSIRTPRLELEGQCLPGITRDDYAEEAASQENKGKIV